MTLRAERSSGFTLVEMAVVLAVMGVLLGVVLTQARPRLAAAQPHAAAVELAASLREARAWAIRTGREVSFNLDLDAGHYQFADQPAHAMPSGIGLGFLGVARGVDEGSNTGRLFFAPDGSASGGTITLTARGQREVIRVNWLNGLVTLAHAP